MPVSSNVNMKSMFKSACEPCSKSKIKCDGSHPCANCVRREQQCIFTFKKKRGPKRSGERDEDEIADRVKRPRQSAMSSYERRVWSVFFTIFKNQKKNAAENPFCWDWFIQQLQRLGNYVHSANSAKGDKLREMLTTFYETLNLSHDEIHNHVTVPCPIPPHLCSICTSTVFDRIVALDKDSFEPNLRLALPVKNRSQLTFDNSWKVTSFQEKFDSNSNACMVFESSLDQFGVFVNPKFTQVFGYTGPSLTDLVTWSGGGFLPWGSDLLAALLVYEADVLLYLQIMNIKYQAHSLPRGLEAYKRFPAVFRGFYKPKGADEEGYQHVEVVKDMYEKHFSKSSSERIGSVTKTFQSKFQGKKIGNSDTEVEHWMDCILDPKIEWVIPSLNVFKCWVNPESVDSDTDFSLDEVKEKLRPKTVEFSCTVRVKQKNNCIHQRLEFVLVNEEIDEEPPTMIVGPTPPRVTNEEPLVPLLSHGEQVQRRSNEDIWAHNSTNNLTHTESSDAEDGENSRENEGSSFEDRMDYTKIFEDDTTGLAGFFTELDLPPPSLNRGFMPQYYPASNVVPGPSYGERKEYRIQQGVASEYQFGHSTMEQGVELEEDLDITWLDDIGNWARD